MPSLEQMACWDSVNKVLVTHSGGKKRNIRTCHYDPGKNTWTKTMEVKILGKLKPEKDVPPGHTTLTVMYFDPVGKVCLLLQKPGWDKKTRKIDRPMLLWTYDAATGKWAKLAPGGAWPPPLQMEDRMRYLCWFDPHHNVFVINTGKKTWVYRHKKAEGAERTGE
jgi:hypothetical protein